MCSSSSLLATITASGNPSSSRMRRASMERYARSPESSRTPTISLPSSAQPSARLARVPDAFDRVVGIDQEHAVVRHRARIGFECLELGVERHYPAMRVGAAHRDVEEPTGEHVRRGAAAADVGGTACGERAVDALGTPESELDHLVPAPAGRVADARRLGRDEGLEVDHVEQGGLDDLALENRPDHPHQRLEGKDHGALPAPRPHPVRTRACSNTRRTPDRTALRRRSRAASGGRRRPLRRR